MDLEVTLPPNASMIAPILITSPCNHSGGAKFQRLMCAHEKAICFGDNLFDEVLSLIDWAVGLIERHQTTREIESRVLSQALSGAPAKWMPELAPDFELYMSSLFSVVYNLPYTTQEFARTNGRDVWGMARAGIPSSRMGDLLSIFPQARAVFIYRNPIDVVSDRKKDIPEAAISEICNDWNILMRDYLTMSSDHLVKIRYEEATQNPSVINESLESMTGLTGFSQEIISEGGEAELETDFELSEEEITQIKTLCADMLAVHYPDLVL